jgi:hypothetical protein
MYKPARLNHQYFIVLPENEIESLFFSKKYLGKQKMVDTFVLKIHYRFADLLILGITKIGCFFEDAILFGKTT